MQWSVSNFERSALKVVIGTVDSSLRDVCKLSFAAENWKERRPNEVRAFVATREMYLLELRLSVGTAIDIKELR